MRLNKEKPMKNELPTAFLILMQTQVQY